ncbi:integrase [Xenorhabdus hominickii]|uniref:Integrase n=1 Tax=Xenorhabdus hominickii TaxID=351679 RepID=A0A2G0Q6Q5_XENHO|nr:integrase [Xenorhabdus hominickii]
MLTVKQVDSAKPKEKPYRLSDINGLYLYIPLSGKKVWQLRYQFEGKEKIHTVGKYPEISLAEARDKVFELKKELANGIDLSKRKRSTEKPKDTFSSIYQE